MTRMSDTPAMPTRLIKAMEALEKAFRRLLPLAIPALKDQLRGQEKPLMADRQELADKLGRSPDDTTLQALEHAYTLALDSIGIFGSGDDPTQSFMAVLRAMRKHCRAQEALFSIRGRFPAIDQYFLEGPCSHGTPGEIVSRENIVHHGADEDPYARGGYSLFVPESYRAECTWPLVIALHGGYGHGRDYLWTWLREARTRGFILFSPSSLGRTWSIGNISADADQLLKHMEDIRSRYAIDDSRILLTGMSDGGTFALGFGLSGDCPARALAPVSCVLPPTDLGGAKYARIYWVHGEQDWMFPLRRAMAGCRELSSAGADVRLRIIPDLSHAYPREENRAILSWFDSSLSIPGS